MKKFKITKGLDIPLAGEPKQELSETKLTKKVAVTGPDYVNMKPTLKVQVGDVVKKGQILFTAKKLEKINFTAPVAGKVTAINRGEKRRFLSLVIEREGNEEVEFNSYDKDELNSLTAEKATEQLLASGFWTFLRTRPFGTLANPDEPPRSIFVNLMDTNPHAPSMSVALEGKEEDLRNGITVLTKLTEGKINVVKSPNCKFQIEENDKIRLYEFEGPHPAGLPGTHIHFIDPVGQNKHVWHIDAQDVAAIGKLFTTGKLDFERVISIAGPEVKNPRLIKTEIGADIDEILQSEIASEDVRIISGSVLSGREAKNELAFLGAYHRQISVLPEPKERTFLGWALPFGELFSVKNVLLTSRKKKLRLTTALNGGRRAIVPIGTYEKVMPLDILPTFLLRMLAVGDVEESEKLGALELIEEDLALCSFVCPAKIDHETNLRNLLNIIQKEG